MFFLMFFNSCSFKEGTELLLWLLRYANNTKEVRQEEKLTFEEASRRLDLYWAINIEDVDKVKQYLKKGYDSNKCRSEERWMVKTPLNVIALSFYNTFFKQKRGVNIPDPPPDAEMLQLLVETGADVCTSTYIRYG